MATDIQIVIDAIALGISVVTVSLLLWYAIETKRMRQASQDQLEAQSKPCLTLVPKPYKSPDGYISFQESNLASTSDGSLLVRNIGNGPALNVRFTAHRRHIHDGTWEPFIGVIDLHTITAAMPVTLPKNLFKGGGYFRLSFEFESFSGRLYQSVITLRQLRNNIGDYFSLLDFEFHQNLAKREILPDSVSEPVSDLQIAKV